MMTIHHIATKKDWETALSHGCYQCESLLTEGFIHCSTSDQLVETANRFFRGRQDLVLLDINPEYINSKILFENFEGGSVLFPHIYGAIPLNAISRIIEFKPSSEGLFSYLPKFRPNKRQHAPGRVRQQGR